MKGVRITEISDVVNHFLNLRKFVVRQCQWYCNDGIRRRRVPTDRILKCVELVSARTVLQEDVKMSLLLMVR